MWRRQIFRERGRAAEEGQNFEGRVRAASKRPMPARKKFGTKQVLEDDVPLEDPTPIQAAELEAPGMLESSGDTACNLHHVGVD